MLGELVKYGVILFIAAVAFFVIWAILQRVPADKDITDINWASTAKRRIRLEERARMRNAEVVPLPDKDVSGGAESTKARVVAPPMPKPVRQVKKTGYWIERGGQLVPTAKAAFIEQWALAALA